MLNFVNSIRLRLTMAFLLLSFICSIVFGATSTFISRVIDDTLFNWYAVENARQLSINPTSELFRQLTGSEAQLINTLIADYQLPAVQAGTTSIMALPQLSNLDRYQNGEAMYELEYNDIELQIASAPTNSDQQLFLIFDISEFASRDGVNKIASDDNAPLLIFIIAIPVTLLGLMIGMMMSRKIIEPLSRLAGLVSGAKPEALPSGFSKQFYQDEVGTLATTIEALIARVEKFIDKEQRFSRDVSHELRTPITSMDMALSLLKHQLSDEKSLKTLARAERANKDMASLIETFLFLGQAEQLMKQAQSVDLTELVESVIEKNRYVLQDKPVEVIVNMSEQARLNCNAQLLEVVIANLLRNAFKHTATGSVQISFDGRALQVKDSGRGIPADKIASITQPYVKLDQAGTGLGLSIVQRIIQSMQWQWHIDSDVGKGCCIQIILVQS